MSVKVLMFGWEFPPHQSGGLGVACKGLTDSLHTLGVDVRFVLPKKQVVDSQISFRFADVPFTLFDKEGSIESQHASSAYVSSATQTDTRTATTRTFLAREGLSLIDKLHVYAHMAVPVALTEDFDLIHAHDWLTYLAGLAAKEATGKPLIVHVHNTIYDRGLGNASPEEAHIERRGITEADAVITVSEYTRQIVIDKYGVPPERVRVVYNGVEQTNSNDIAPALEALKEQGKKIVLCHGRVTVQKGVEYFVDAAEIVVQYDPNVVFIISGWGDQVHEMIERVAAKNLSDKFIFVPVCWGKDRDSLYKAADVLVMPSVSEPFGIVPLEAALNYVPLIVSKTSGAAEVMHNALKVDFWDKEAIANKILAIITNPPLQKALSRGSRIDAESVTWDKAAEACLGHYVDVLAGHL